MISIANVLVIQFDAINQQIFNAFLKIAVLVKIAVLQLIIL